MSRSYYILIAPIILNFDLTLFPKLEKKSYFAQELTGHLHLLILYPIMCLLVLYHAALNLISMSPVVRMLSPKALVCRWFQPKISWVYLQYKNS